MSEFHVKVRGEKKGPYSAEQLHTQIRRKRLSRQHPVSLDGGVTWLRAGEVESLFPSVPQAELIVNEPEPIVEEPAEQAVSQVVPGAEQQWSYSVMGQQLGPVPESEIRMLISSGGISPETLLWREGMTDWMEVKHIPTFSAAIRSRNPAAQSAAQSAAATTIPGTELQEMHWHSVVAFVVTIAAWTTLLPAAISSLTICGAISGRSPIESVLAMMLVCAISLTPSLLFCITGLHLGHKAMAYIKSEPGRYTGTTYAIFSLILGYLTVVAYLAIAVTCIVSASR